MNRKKSIMAGALLLAILSGVAACDSAVAEPEDNRITVRLAAPQNAYVEDFDTNLYKLWLEEQTGLKIEMTWLPVEDAERSAMIALTTGKDLPDAYIGFGTYSLFSSQNL
ncbi:MAG: hypothetical protein FWG31_04725 [Oscillospiraceae bacterium]|nr:hypothetical protein [Oscillospiraceae bacterium]